MGNYNGIPERNISGATFDERTLTVDIRADIVVPEDVTEVRIVVNGQRAATLQNFRIHKFFNQEGYEPKKR